MEQALLNKYIGNKIKELRKKKNLTQEELGKQIGVKHSTISSYERGLIDFNLTTLFSLAEVFEVKVDDLFPPRKPGNEEHFDITKGLYTKNLSAKEMYQLQQFFEKLNVMEPDERASFIQGLMFASHLHNEWSQKK